MELRQIFNVFLLALILTTVISTLVVYLVFKFRQGIQVVRQKEVELEGEFFRRHAPHLVEEYLREEAELEKTRVKRYFSAHKSKWLVVSLFLLIVLFLSVENYLHYRNTLIERQTNAEEYLDLLKGGLLKKHPFLPNKIVKTPLDNFSYQKSAYAKFLGKKFKSKKFVLIESFRAKANKASKHSLALKNWLEFCKRNSLNCSTENIRQFVPDKTKLYILPNVDQLSEFERVQIVPLMEEGHKVLFTGAIGVYNGLQKESGTWFLQSYLPETSFKFRQSDRSAYSSKFSFSNRDYYFLPAALQLDWRPLNEEFYVLSESLGKSVFASDFRGHKYIEGAMFEIRSRRVSADALWLNLDALSDYQLERNELLNYTDEFLLQSLAQFYADKVRPMKWKYGADVVGLLNLVSEDQFLKMNPLIKVLKDLDIPFTWFTQALSYEEQYSQLKHEVLDKLDYELALSNFDSSRFQDLNFTSAFDKIESGRLLLERKHKKVINGFKPSEFYFDEKLFSAAEQNGLNYIVSSYYNYTSEPIYIEADEISLLSTKGLLDLDLVRDPNLVKPEDLNSITQEFYNKSMASEAPFQIYFHTHVFGEDNYRQFAEHLIRRVKLLKNVWWTKNNNMVEWQKSLSFVDYWIDESGNLEIVNNSSKDIEALSFLVDHKWKSEKLEAIEISPGKYSLDIPVLGAGEIILFSRTNER